MHDLGCQTAGTASAERSAKQLEYPGLGARYASNKLSYGAGVVLIEDKASGTQLIQDLIREGLAAVTRYQPAGDKIMRMHAQTAVIENGFVHLPAEAPWLEDYLHELAFFPNGRYDDQVDSTAQFLDWFKTPFIGQNMYELLRRKQEPPSSAASHNLLKPCPSLARWSGSRRRRRRAEPSGGIV